MLNNNNEQKIVIAVIIIAAVIFLSYCDSKQVVTENVTINEMTIKDISDCQNLSFIEQTNCMIEYLSPYYNYTHRSDIDRSIDEVLTNGGDCYDWSHVYAKLGNQLGLNTRVEYIFVDGSRKGHAFTIIWDKNLTGYCIVDNLELNCRG